jgi:hypothetical protein
MTLALPKYFLSIHYITTMEFLQNNPLILKSVSAIGIAALADHYVLKVEDWTSNLMFGGAAAVGLAIGGYATSLLPFPDNLPSMDNLYSTKTVLQRVSEISLGAGVSWGIHTYVFKNNYSPSQYMNQIAVLAVVDIGSEYMKDYITGQTLNYFLPDN